MLQPLESAGNAWFAWLGPGGWGSVARVAFLGGIGLPAVFLLASFLGRLGRKRIGAQAGMLFRRGVLYLGTAVILVAVLREFGFDLTALLGAAGVFAVAVGFAAQTSLSNIISGLFLISEKPFAVDDLITIGSTTGRVLSIDLLSVKIRTFDNRFVRIPNEHLIRTEVVNITRFPIRRIDVEVGVAYRSDVERVKEILAEVARDDPRCLDEPEPVILFKNFGDSALEFLFGVWCVHADFLELKNSIMATIKTRFDQEGIEIPFPHRTIYTGAQTDALPVRLTRDREEGQ